MACDSKLTAGHKHTRNCANLMHASVGIGDTPLKHYQAFRGWPLLRAPLRRRNHQLVHQRISPLRRPVGCALGPVSPEITTVRPSVSNLNPRTGFDRTPTELDSCQSARLSGRNVSGKVSELIGKSATDSTQILIAKWFDRHPQECSPR